MKHRLVITIAIVALAAGCATVQPWERESLADPIMELDENPIGSARLSRSQNRSHAAQSQLKDSATATPAFVELL